MGHSMDRGNTGNQNKPKLSTKEKKQKKIQKQLTKQQATANTITVPNQH